MLPKFSNKYFIIIIAIQFIIQIKIALSKFQITYPIGNKFLKTLYISETLGIGTANSSTVWIELKFYSQTKIGLKVMKMN